MAPKTSDNTPPTRTPLRSKTFCTRSRNLKAPAQPERREGLLQELVRKARKPVVLFIDEAYDIYGHTLNGLKWLMELILTLDDCKPLHVTLPVSGHGLPFRADAPAVDAGGQGLRDVARRTRARFLGPRRPGGGVGFLVSMALVGAAVAVSYRSRSATLRDMARVSTPVMVATDTPVNVRPNDTAALAVIPPWAQ